MADDGPTGYRGPFPRLAGGRRRWLRWLPGARLGSPRALAPDLLPSHARVLLVRPDHLGDLLFVGPALSLLRRRRPDLALHLLVGPWAREVAAGLPGEARVETFAFPWFDRRPSGRAWEPCLRLWRGARALRGRFDAAVILRPDDHLSAWMAALAGIPLRVGHAHPHLRPFLTHDLPGAEDGHAAARNLDLAAALTGDRAPPGGWDPVAHPLAFRMSAEGQRRAEALTAGAAPAVAVHPGSGAAVKRWRPEAWAEVVRAITSPGEPVLLTGGPGEAALTAELAALLPDRGPLDLAGRTDLAALAALQAGCRLVLGPDSGPLHLAVAAGVPTVHLFGPASAGRFGPWGPHRRHRVVASALDCAPCGHLAWDDLAAHPCIRDLEPGRVVAAARDLLASGPAPGPGPVGPGPGRGL
jgi:heptosyltransferase-2/heptosyltransferase-3